MTSMTLKCPTALSGVTCGSFQVVSYIGIGFIRKITVVLASISSISNLTSAVVLHLKLHTLSFIPPVFESKAAL